LLQTDCSTALVAPFDTLLTIDAASPWNLKISQTQTTGYPNVNVCYKCNNGYGVGTNTHIISAQITIRQKIDCTTALGGGVNSTSSLKDYNDPTLTHYAAKPYVASPEYLALSEYTLGSTMFSNINIADCGDFTACVPLPVGCTGTYAGRA
jgi:hypothetical protein